MPRWRVVAVVVAGLLACAPAAAVAADAVRMNASFDADARLGGQTAMRFGMRVDPLRLPAPVSEIRVRYPSSLGIATSGLGLATCSPPASEFDAVIVELVGLAGCPRNAVMGYGRAVARVQVGALVIPATAAMTLLAGPVERERMRLVAFIDGVNPFGVKLLYGGELRPAPPPFGEDLSVRFPPMTGIPADARFALVYVQLEIGSPRVVYHDELGRRYRPEAITLPQRCPTRGFRFVADLEFQDGRTATTSTTAPCPPPARPASSAR